MSDGVDLRVDGVAYHLVTERWGPSSPTVVFVHDGLGSIGQWRDVPVLVAERTGRSVLAYDRAGHGSSTPSPDGPWPTDWLQREAHVLAALLEQVAGQPVHLVGHSDGGTIALLCAADRPDLVDSVVALAAHAWVEPVCVRAIAALQRAPGGTLVGLGRYHRRPRDLFEAWTGGWTSPGFAHWDIRPVLDRIDAPVLVVQGDRDEYATTDMAWGTAAAIGPSAQVVVVPGGVHALHHQQPGTVVDLVVRAVSA